MTHEGNILSWSYDGLRQWNPRTGAQIGITMRSGTLPVNGALLTNEGNILSWSGRNTLQLWDAISGTPLGAVMRPHGEVRGVLLTHEGKILSWTNEGLQLWDPKTSAKIGPKIRLLNVFHALITETGTILGWGGNTLSLIDPASSAQIGLKMQHDDRVRGALLTKAGRILSWSEDGTLRLWDSATGAQIVPAIGHGDRVTGALLTPGGKILSWSNDGTLRFWNIVWPDGKLLEVACSLLPDHKLTDISLRYGTDIRATICDDERHIPYPDWSVMK
jgi:WD40 repeat protein